MSHGFNDLFSAQADHYARFRPQYPDELYDFLRDLTGPDPVIWDCATGNGQAAIALARFAREVYATDASHQQIINARPAKNVIYLECTAEYPPFCDRCFDLVTVAQALHWFRFKAFYKQVNRVLKPGAHFVAWTYGIPKISDSVDEVVEHYYRDVVGKYWPLRRHYVDALYRTLPFPLNEINTPHLEITANWTSQDFLGFLNTWSATNKYITDKNANPLDLIRDKLYQAWDSNGTRTIRWPMAIRAGYN